MPDLNNLALKPCPFCGADDVRLINDSTYTIVGKVIYCISCDIFFGTDNCIATDDDLARAWNNRNQSAQNCTD